MNVWMDGWMDGRMDGWMDGWMDGRIYICPLPFWLKSHVCCACWLKRCGFCLPRMERYPEPKARPETVVRKSTNQRENAPWFEWNSKEGYFKCKFCKAWVSQENHLTSQRHLKNLQNWLPVEFHRNSVEINPDFKWNKGWGDSPMSVEKGSPGGWGANAAAAAKTEQNEQPNETVTLIKEALTQIQKVHDEMVTMKNDIAEMRNSIQEMSRGVMQGAPGLALSRKTQ